MVGLGIEGVTTEVKGFGRQKGRTDIYRGSEYSVDFVPKAKIEIVVADSGLDAAIAVLAQSARTGKIGDGKIFISRVEQGPANGKRFEASETKPNQKKTTE